MGVCMLWHGRDACIPAKASSPHCPHYAPAHLLDHNNRHAADVLHATFYLLTEPIPEFDHQFHEDGSARIRWVGLANGRGWQLLVRNT